MERAKTIISILNYNGSQDTIACLNSFYSYEEKNRYSIVVWDNASQIEEKEILSAYFRELKGNVIICDSSEYQLLEVENYDAILVFSDVNLGFAVGNNEVLRNQLDKFNYVVLLNNDTDFIENTTSHLVEYLNSNDEVGVVTTAIYYYYKPNSIWNAGGRVFGGTRKYYTENYVEKLVESGTNVKEVDFITGCYFAVRSEVLKEYGLLTERFFFGEEDYEFCMRMKKAQIKMVVLLKEKMYHKVGASIKRNQDVQGIVRRTFVHHLNRFVDMKQHYSLGVWTVWRWCSSCYIFILMLRNSGYKFRWIIRYIKQLNKYAVQRDNVNREFFIQIISGEII